MGYFRLKGDRLEHVYGVHYDMDERRDGHPVFHAQLGRAREEFASVIRNEFHAWMPSSSIVCGRCCGTSGCPPHRWTSFQYVHNSAPIT